LVGENPKAVVVTTLSQTIVLINDEDENIAKYIKRGHMLDIGMFRILI
jgi:hypothetical protein